MKRTWILAAVLVGVLLVAAPAQAGGFTITISAGRISLHEQSCPPVWVDHYQPVFVQTPVAPVVYPAVVYQPVIYEPVVRPVFVQPTVVRRVFVQPTVIHPPVVHPTLIHPTPWRPPYPQGGYQPSGVWRGAERHGRWVYMPVYNQHGRPTYRRIYVAD